MTRTTTTKAGADQPIHLSAAVAGRVGGGDLSTAPPSIMPILWVDTDGTVGTGDLLDVLVAANGVY